MHKQGNGALQASLRAPFARRIRLVSAPATQYDAAGALAAHGDATTLLAATVLICL